MDWTRPTPAEFKARYPRFNAVADATIQFVLDDAPVDETWTNGDFKKAIMLYGAHALTIEGLGTGADAQIIAGAGAGVSKYKAGDTEITFAGVASGSGSVAAGTTYALTTFGASFAELMLINCGGPIALGGEISRPNHLARDWSGWPFVVG